MAILSKKSIGLLLLFIVLAGLLTWPIYVHPDHWGIQDWDDTLFWQAFGRDTLLEYKQIPLWCPYLLGGMPYLARTETSLFSPAFLFILSLGEGLGSRVLISFHLLIGLIGMYALARYLKCGIVASIFASSLFNLSSAYALVATTGMVYFTPFTYFPWIFLFYLRGRDDLRWFIACGAMLSLVILEGAVYLFVIMVFFLMLHTLLHLKVQGLRSLKGLLISFVVACGIGAVKILPFYELIRQYPRTIGDVSGYTLKSFWFSLTNPAQRIISPLWSEVLSFGNYYACENGMYIGWIACIIATVGVAISLRQQKALAAALFILTWILFGAQAPISLWEGLHVLPVFDSMRVAQRFRFPFLMLFTLFAGFGLTFLGKFLKRQKGRGPFYQMILHALMLFYVFNLTAHNSLIFFDAFRLPSLKLERMETFKQSNILFNYDEGGFLKRGHHFLSSYSARYPAYLLNRGSANDMLSHASLPRHAVPHTNDSYKGETYLLGGGVLKNVDWTPNVITVNVDAKKGDRVMVNQNFYRGWKVHSELKRNYVVEQENGLISVKLDEGSDKLKIYYLPLSFLIGALVSLITIFICVFYQGKSRLMVKKG